MKVRPDFEQMCTVSDIKVATAAPEVVFFHCDGEMLYASNERVGFDESGTAGHTTTATTTTATEELALDWWWGGEV